ncbi:MAG: relaxase domain-containing protein [Gordonia polyisoprenivorans]|nr:relaxase domain-containing protein [Gordonia polyisoprenivorans]
MDATDKGKVSLADYYSAKGESPGVWMGSGLAGLAELSVPPALAGHAESLADLAAAEADSDHPAMAHVQVAAGSMVTAEQMRALYGEGRHPNADQIERACRDAGMSALASLAPTKLGSEYAVYREHTEFVRELARRFAEHNTSRGQAWDAPLDPAEKARLRTDVATERFHRAYARAPHDERELSGFIARQTRQKQSAVAGYDMTFSPVKSVSTLWAVAPLSVANTIEDAHRRAVADALAFIESQACFSRLGADGIAQVSTDGVIAAAFTHRDSRAGDPDLHTHVTISNKVRVRDAAGITKWVALDGTPLYKAVVTASEVYNSRLETYCAAELGVRFRARAHADARKRPIREIDGIPTDLMQRWSTRRAAIEERTAELAAQFHADHGREPTSTEAFDLAQQATLETREKKHEPRSYAEQRHAWRAQAEHVLGGERAVHDMVRHATTRSAETPVRHDPLSAAERDEIAETIIGVVSAGRARWQRPHLRAEAERQLRANNFYGYRTHAEITAAVEAIVDTALAPDRAVAVSSDALDGERGEPEALRRADGTSVFIRHDTALFTNQDILDAEQRIVAAARRTDGRRIDERTVDLALLEQTANDRELNAAQTAMVRALATSGRRVQAVLAPAGTGKTTAMRTLAAAWKDSGASIIGLAPTAAAAAVLREELATTTDTLAKLVDVITTEQISADAERVARDRTALASVPMARRERVAYLAEVLRSGEEVEPAVVPDWVRRIGPDTLVVIDEAGMAGTHDLDTAISFVCARGGSVRLVGDDQQLASISAGGVLRDVAHETGALTLSQVVRFANPAEGAASLAFRDGDRAALGFYADQHRIHVASDAVAADQAYTAWAADRTAGRDTVMLAATREVVNALNDRARADCLAAHPDAPRDSVRLSDGLRGGVGDIICTRRNKRDLRTSATDWVRNGDRWEVTELHTDGALSVRNLDTGRHITLPARYVAEDVTLGYASTIHAAQGMTADTCHVVGSDTLTRQLLYVAMTRGRHGNHVYLSTAETDPHNLTTPKARHPNTGIEVLESILARDEAQQSATTAAREATDPFRRLARAAGAYDYALGAAAEHTLGADAVTALEYDADQLYATLRPDDQRRLSEQPAWPVLRHHLATLEMSSGDARARLQAAITRRDTDSARDLAAVLDWRLDPTGSHSAGHGPLPWLPTIPAVLGTDGTWGTYLTARTTLVTDLAEDIRSTAHAWDAATAPSWARPYLLVEHPDTTLVADLAVYRAAVGVDDADRRPTGPDHPALRVRAHQRRLDERAHRVVADAEATSRWTPLIESIDPHILTDPYWPDLAEQLSAAARAGIDVHTIVRAAATEPLPTEVPAAALWWRLAEDLAPAAVAATGTGIRPDWINELPAIVGDRAAEVIITDPHWPGLVAAVDAADPQHWSPTDVLRTADELLHGGGDGDDHVRLDEYATLLTWRVDLLVRTSHLTYDLGDPTEPLDPDVEEQTATAAGAPDPWANPDVDTTPAAAPRTDTTTAADTATTVVPGDAVVPGDEDLDAYLAALAADEPPPEPGSDPDLEEQYHCPDDWQALPTSPPAVPDRAVAPVDLADCVALRYELVAQLDEARAERTALRAAIDAGTSPALSALTPTLIALRTTADRQHPAAVAVADAHHDLAHTTTAAEDLDAQITALRRTAEQLRALAADNSADLDPLDDTEPADITALRTELQIQQLTWHAESLRAHSDTLTEALTAAEDHLAQIVADTGGTRITHADVERYRWNAEELDLLTDADLRRRCTTLEDRIWRIDRRLAHHHATTETALAQHLRPSEESAASTTSGPGPDATANVTAEAGRSSDRGESPDPATALEHWLRHDPVRVLTDSALAARLRSLHRRHAAALTDLAAGKPRDLHADRVRAEHTALHDTATRIHQARHYADLAATAAATLARARADLDALGPAPRRGKAAHADHARRHEQLAAAAAAAAHAHTAAIAARDTAAVAVGHPEHQWDHILHQDSDTGTRASELAHAERADTAAMEFYTTSIAARDRAAASIHRGRAEQTRRAGLDPDRKTAEDAIREQIAQQHLGESGTTAAPTSVAPRVATPTSAHIPTISSVGPDNERGL